MIKNNVNDLDAVQVNNFDKILKWRKEREKLKKETSVDKL